MYKKLYKYLILLLICLFSNVAYGTCILQEEADSDYEGYTIYDYPYKTASEHDLY